MVVTIATYIQAKLQNFACRHREISELTKKREILQKELSQEEMGTPEEQRERLLSQVKEDNQSIATMERKITDLTNRTSELQTELADLENEDEAISEDKKVSLYSLALRSVNQVR